MLHLWWRWHVARLRCHPITEVYAVTIKTVGIVLEAWKVPIFEKQLTDAGYKFETAPVSIKVVVDSISASDYDVKLSQLHKIVKVAVELAKGSKHD